MLQPEAELLIVDANSDASLIWVENFDDISGYLRQFTKPVINVLRGWMFNPTRSIASYKLIAALDGMPAGMVTQDPEMPAFMS